jgi:hypothetical protein
MMGVGIVGKSKEKDFSQKTVRPHLAYITWHRSAREHFSVR